MFSFILPYGFGSILLSSWKPLNFFFLTSVRFVGGGWGSSVKYFRHNWGDLIHSEFSGGGGGKRTPMCNKHLDLKCVPLPELSLLSLLTLLIAGGYNVSPATFICGDFLVQSDRDSRYLKLPQLWALHSASPITNSGTAKAWLKLSTFCYVKHLPNY